MSEFIPTNVLHLAKLLKDASDAHHTYEVSIGHPDSDWPTWYANFMLNGHSQVVENEPRHGWINTDTSF